MKQRIFGAVLAAAAVTAGAFLSACSLFRDTTDGVFDDGEDLIATDRASSSIDTAEFQYEFGDGGTLIVRYEAPDHVRVDVWDGDRTAVFCLTGSSGWMYVRGDVIDMTAEDIAEMHSALLQTLPFQVNFQDLFGDAELQEKTEFVCGEECNVIHANFRRGAKFPVRLWFGKDSDQLVQFEVTREDGVHTMQYFDYRVFEDDVTLPLRMFRFSPEGATKITLVLFEANAEIPEYVFQKPVKLSSLGGDKE